MTNRTLFEIQFELLKKELDLVDGAIRQHDDITKGIKNWAIVTWSASVGLFASTEELRQFIWVTILVPCVFWLVDASFRRIQRSFITRADEISRYINSDSFRQSALSGAPLEFSLLQMRTKSANWLSSSENWENTLLGTMLFYSVSFLYLGLSLGSILIWRFSLSM